jgi:hypothetical protein
MLVSLIGQRKRLGSIGSDRASRPRLSNRQISKSRPNPVSDRLGANSAICATFSEGEIQRVRRTYFFRFVVFFLVVLATTFFFAATFFLTGFFFVEAFFALVTFFVAADFLVALVAAAFLVTAFFTGFAAALAVAFFAVGAFFAGVFFAGAFSGSDFDSTAFFLLARFGNRSAASGASSRILSRTVLLNGDEKNSNQ